MIHPDDVRRAIDGGLDGIYCSTHGGRQANGGIACLDMLPAVVEAAGKTPVLFDSGVRSGSDVVKAPAASVPPPSASVAPMPGAWPSTGRTECARIACLLAEADLLMAIDGTSLRTVPEGTRVPLYTAITQEGSVSDETKARLRRKSRGYTPLS